MIKNISVPVQFIIVFLMIHSCVFAATATPTSLPSSQQSNTPTPTTEKSQKIEDLKDRLATKVAELRQKERRAMYGTVKSISVSTMHIDMETKDIKIELTDDMKVFQILKGKRTTLTVDDIAKNDRVTVFGEYDTTLELLRAKVVFIENTQIEHISGVITDVNKKDYTITITTQQDVPYVIDYETSTKLSVLSTSEGLSKGGFSKLISGDTVFITGTLVLNKDKRISALRIVNIGNFTGEKPISTPTPTNISPTPTLKP